MKLFQQQRIALGSNAELTLVTDQPEHIVQSWFSDLWQMIENFEQRFSRFRSDSELCRINRLAGQRTDISPDMHDLLSVAKRQAILSAGIFNPFILPTLEQVGYTTSWLSPAAPKITPTAGKLVAPISALELGDTWVQIPATAALDLGGCGKGYLLDQLTQQVKLWTNNFWLSLGGDMMVSGHDADGSAWEVGVAAALQPELDYATITVPVDQPMAIATSGVTKRRGTTNGQSWNHLIDPRTDQSAHTSVLTATVCAQSATQADVWASCAVILGKTAGTNLLEQRGVAQYYLQTTSL